MYGQDLRLYRLVNAGLMRKHVINILLLGVMWATFYRKSIPGSRSVAGVAFMFIVLHCLVLLLNAQDFPEIFEWWRFYFFVYVGLAHLLFAVFGKEDASVSGLRISIRRETDK